MSSVILGGTFSRLHEGHRQLLMRAKPFSVIHIGLTTDALAHHMHSEPVPKAVIRLSALRHELKRLGLYSRCRIFPIVSRSGPAREMKNLDAIIVSPETEPVAQKINHARLRRRLRPLHVIVVPYSLAQDGLPISATRIQKGEINANGKRLTPLRVAVGSDNPAKLAGARSAFMRAFPRLPLQIRGFKVDSGVHEQPLGFKQTWAGASRRAERAKKRWPNADYSLGLESGLIPFGSRHFDIQFCALSDGTSISAGSSMGFPIPSKIDSLIFHTGKPHLRKSMGAVISKLAKIKNIGRKGGAIAYLSRGLLTRAEMVEQAILCAFIERRSPMLASKKAL